MPMVMRLAWSLLLVGLPTSLLPAFTEAAPENDTSESRQAMAAQSGGGYRVFATREGLVGGQTSSGHIITPWDYFVSLPACTSTSCPWSSPGQPGKTSCGSICYVKVTNPQTGACRTEPILDVGPWFTVDDWWSPADIRFLNQLPSNRQILPQGLPGAQAARDGLNVGYGWGSSDVYAMVGNQAGIDLADGTYWSLDLGGPVGDMVDVEMLWQTGESPSAAAQSCGHVLGGGGGAIPRWTPTPAPTVPLTQWGTARVSDTGGSGLNCRTAPSGSGTVITVLAEGATVTLRGPASGGWYPVICAGRAGYASASYLSVTSTSTPTPTITTTSTATATASPSATTTATGTTTATPSATATGTVTPTATATESATPSATTTETAATGSVTPTITAFPSETAAITPTSTPANTSTPSPSPSPTATTPPSITATATTTLIPTSTATAGPVIWGTSIVQKTGGAGLNCRVGPSTSAGVITVLPEGARVSLTGSSSGGWQPVLCSGRQGYVSSQYLSASQNTPTPLATATRTQAPSPVATRTPTATLVASTTATATIAATSTRTASPTGTAAPANWGTGTVRNTGGAGLNCRVGPSTSTGVITVLAEGARVQLTGPASGGWQPVLCANRQGYVSSGYLSAAQNTPTPTATAQLTFTARSGDVTPTTTAIPPIATVPMATPTAFDVPTEAQTSTPLATPTDEPTLATTATIAAAPTELATEVPTEEITTSGWVVGTGTGLACLAAPSWDSTLVTVIPDGTEIVRFGDSIEGWQAVACGDSRGYVDATYLSTTLVTAIPELVETAEPLPVETDIIETETPPEVPSEPIDVAPETYTLAPVAETSILRTMPDVPQSGVTGGALLLGGPDGGVVALTFDASGYADGTIIKATLLITGAGDFAGSGGSVLAVTGGWVDPTTATIATVDSLGGSAVGWLEVTPGMQSAVDVTGVVSGGAITFVITGTDSPVAIASSTSGSGPVLVITVQAP